MLSISIHRLFVEHLATNRNGEERPCDGCVAGEEPTVDGRFVYQEIDGNRTIIEREVDKFRIAMASLRYRQVELATETVDSLSPELKYISPVTKVFKNYVFCEKNGHSPGDFWYDKENWQNGMGELFTFRYRPESSTGVMPLVSVLFLPIGSVCWKDFQGRSRKERFDIFRCRKNQSLLQHLYDLWRGSKSSYIILTDEHSVEIINRVSPSCVGHKLSICGWSAPLSNNLSLRCAIGAALNKASPSEYRYHSGIAFQPLRGALNYIDASLSTLPIATNGYPTCFLDFDLFTMQRHFPDFASFLDWKESSEVEVLSQPLQPGDKLIICSDGFVKRTPPLPFFLPLEKPPTVTLDPIMKRPRPRHLDVDDILTQARVRTRGSDNIGTLHFLVTEIVRTGDKKFSQVVFGRLQWTSADEKKFEDTNSIVCLKMFDELLFPVPGEEAFQDDRDIFFNPIFPSQRLLDLNFADDMMRREYAVYERLEYLQGTLLPHSYGFHEVILPTGRIVNGFIMEVISGRTLGSLPVQVWSENVQKQLVRRLRQGVSALRYAGIKQGDWNLDQILVTHPSPTEASGDDFEFDVVFIDFAFTHLRQGITMGLQIAEALPQGNDLQELLFLWQAIPRHIAEGDWYPFDDYEH
ncbi:hypothetical protein L218DRAFT_1080023 [Marasmius fiardii PR-910]|nr:hypothetical protein L218DRAFT_1080023 [Marasmius fiardii PR-910]